MEGVSCKLIHPLYAVPVQRGLDSSCHPPQHDRTLSREKGVLTGDN